MFRVNKSELSMKDNEMKIEAKDVKVGMHVTRLDKPWLESPFMLQGFIINNEDELKVLVANCMYCYIDIHLSRTIIPTTKYRSDVTNRNVKIAPKKPLPKQTSFKLKRNYKELTEMTDELKNVRIPYKNLSNTVKEMMQSLKLNKKLDLVAIKTTLKPMVNSIIRNPDALLWLTRLRQLDEYNYSHALGCSIWAMSLGRQLGFNRNDIESLGLGGLLIDVGKTRISKKILTKKGMLTDEEFAAIKGHVQHGMDMINKESDINYKVRNMVESHHERVDGSGYPNALTNENSPLFGKIAAIVDCYDAITSDRCYAKPLSSQQAVKKLYEWRDKEFHSELVEEFIQAIGMFPAGTLVELSTGEVAVVISESRTRRLRPKVMILLNADKSEREDFIICNMLNETHSK
ncbi:MAG: HD-GYP domain-containing protein, partial [Gammaproteobacteria bacterium]|nr:HD-GYP domain-containing protein [Gammaproteobacteria bacterium]